MGVGVLMWCIRDMCIMGECRVLSQGSLLRILERSKLCTMKGRSARVQEMEREPSASPKRENEATEGESN